MSEPTEPHNETTPPASPSLQLQLAPPNDEIRIAQSDVIIGELHRELEMLQRRVIELPEQIAQAIETEQPPWSTGIDQLDVYASGVQFGFKRASAIARRFGETHS